MKGVAVGRLRRQDHAEVEEAEPGRGQALHDLGQGPEDRVRRTCSSRGRGTPMVRARPWVPYLYCAPLVVLLAFIFGYPMVKVVDFSTRLVRGSSGPFIGLDNYRNTIDDPTFRERRAPQRDAAAGRARPARRSPCSCRCCCTSRCAAGASTAACSSCPTSSPCRSSASSRATCSRCTASSTTCSRRSGCESLVIDWIGSEHYALMTVADRDRLARGRLRHRALPGPADEPRRGAARGRAHRRRRLVAAALARDPAGVARHDRVLRRDRRDDRAGVRVRVRVDAHAGRARATRRRRSRSTSTTRARCSRCPARPRPSRRCCSVVMCPFIALLFWVRRRAAREAARGGGVSTRREPRRAVRAARASRTSRTTSCSSAPRCSRSARCCSCS